MEINARWRHLQYFEHQTKNSMNFVMNFPHLTNIERDALFANE